MYKILVNFFINVFYIVYIHYCEKTQTFHYCEKTQTFHYCEKTQTFHYPRHLDGRTMQVSQDK